MSQEDIQNAVNTAAETIETENAQPVAEKPEGDKPEISKEPEVDQRTVQALQLLDALENPKLAPSVIQSLMQQAGIAQPETKREERQALRSIKDTIREKLGPDFEFLSEKLGDAFEEVMASETKKVREEFLSIEQSRTQRELANEYNQFLSENKVSDEEAGAISKLVDEIPPTGNIPLPKYLGRLLKMHRSEVAEEKAELAKKQRQKENLQRRPESAGIEGNEERISRGSRIVSAREAVEAAARGELLD